MTNLQRAHGNHRNLLPRHNSSGGFAIFTAILRLITRHSDPLCVPCLSQSFTPGALNRSSSSLWSAALLSFISLNKQRAAVEYDGSSASSTLRRVYRALCISDSRRLRTFVGKWPPRPTTNPQRSLSVKGLPLISRLNSGAAGFHSSRKRITPSQKALRKSSGSLPELFLVSSFVIRNNSAGEGKGAAAQFNDGETDENRGLRQRFFPE